MAFRPVAYAQRIGWRWAVIFAAREQDERRDTGLRFWSKRRAEHAAAELDRTYDRGGRDEYFARDDA